MHMMKLEWKEFNVDLKTLDAQLRASYPTYAGNQAHSCLELWFTEEPSQEDKELIQLMWDEIDSDQHAMAQSYQSAGVVKAEAEAKKASAKAKLAALGLTEDELKALLG